jgi:hypothetical protein
MNRRSTDGEGSIIVRHREYCGDLVIPSGGGFMNLLQFPINPGMATFPWLSQVSTGYTEYKLLGAVVEFKSTTSVYASTNTLGVVIIATQYDSTQPPFTSKVAMENYEFATSTRTTESMLHPIECDPKQTAIASEFYIRYGSLLPMNADIRMYDWGRVEIAAAGAPNVNAGEIWISYEFELLKPRLGGVVSPYAYYSGGANSNTYPFNNFLPVNSTDGKPFGNMQLILPTNANSLPSNEFAITDSRLIGKTIQIIYSWSSDTSTGANIPTEVMACTGGSATATTYYIGSQNGVPAPSITTNTAPFGLTAVKDKMVRTAFTITAFGPLSVLAPQFGGVAPQGVQFRIITTYMPIGAIAGSLEVVVCRGN